MYYRFPRVWSAVFCLGLMLTSYATAQLKATEREKLFGKFSIGGPSHYRADASYYLCEWTGSRPQPARIVRQINENLAITEVLSPTAYEALSKVCRLAVANNDWKYPGNAAQLIAGGNQKFILTGASLDLLLKKLVVFSKDLQILTTDKPSHSVVVKCNAGFLKRYLADLKEITFIDVVHTASAEAPIIGYDRSFHGIGALAVNLPGANGNNIVVGVKEQQMDENDLDLRQRVLFSPIAGTSRSQHSTVIASIIAGAGNSYYDGRGLAWASRLFPSSFANLFADDETVLNANNVTVQNHSYGTVIQPFYGAEAVSYDVQTWRNKHFVPVFSGGNQGESFAGEGRYANLPGFANLTGNFKAAKNVITVAAINSNDEVPVQSSAGPLYDGRIAPQVTALGPNGTSDAAALVSGTVAVMQQVYAERHSGVLPSAALIKAILYNTTDAIYNLGIDYKTGYGLMNSYAAVNAMRRQQYFSDVISTGQRWAKTIRVPANAAALKVTLSWTDSAAGVNNYKALVHDLDLEVTETATGRAYHPWVLNTSAHIDSLALPPTRKRDSLNTAEQVSITLPSAGNYELSISSLSQGIHNLPFSIAYRVDTLNTFSFVSPQHASDVNRTEHENTWIRWQTFVRDTNHTGNLYVSYNSGSSWGLISRSIRLAHNKYRWLIPDTTAIAVLKMETTFGEFTSKPFYVGKPTTLNVEFNCSDSFALSWHKNKEATAYHLYRLTDSPYLQLFATVTDTFVVIQKSGSSTAVYAVEPILRSGSTAIRSAALDINQFGTQCFYKTFNYHLLDQNRLSLQLELSSSAFVDSVIFEQVTATGGLVQVYKALPVQERGTSQYTYVVNNLQSGITHIRARIILKSGAVVYTEIIPVLTSGKRSIWFYPNPAARNNPFQRVLQQGVPIGSQLLLYDGLGRLLRSYTSVPDNVNTNGLPTGLIIYKLLNSESKLVETGKLMIR
ncbi:S8 family serine peptidase [Segetibacter sp. 3557_3]|uniref:S8 family serine peptidase n=1 Tax=Segetibacter sp. 3557_3 TaxID=2547429 RepID=UPI00140531B7|nr:S8 family serine peptidase [Segetibacter sp. 3557_3]